MQPFAQQHFGLFCDKVVGHALSMRRLARLHPLIFVLLGVAVVLGCFANKAVSIDDPLFIWTADQIRTNPFDFYGFQANWSGTPQPVSQLNFNPPLVAYFLALERAMLGTGELTMHLVFILPALAVAVGIFYLAKPVCKQPILAVLIAVLSPIFLVSSTTLMCDMPMLMFWVWSLVVWRLGLQTRPWLLPVAGLLAGLGILTKYNAILVLPLMALAATVARKRWFWSAAGLLVPILMLVGYEIVTARLYGKGLFAMSAAAAEAKREALVQERVIQSIVCLSFLGAGIASAGLASFRLWSWRKIGIGGGAAALLLLGFCLSREKLGPVSVSAGEKIQWSYVVQVVFWAVCGLSVLAGSLRIWWEARDETNTVLLAWVVLCLLNSAFVNWMLSGRSLLPVLPAVSVLLARRLGELPQARNERWRLWLPLALAGCLAIAVAVADYCFANSVRSAARKISQELGAQNRPIWFQGHWGFQYYMQQAGYSPLDLARPAAEPGDWVVTPYNNVMICVLPPEVATAGQTITNSPLPFLATVNVDAGAGFYTSHFGAIPFVFGKIPGDVYYLQRLGVQLSPILR